MTSLEIIVVAGGLVVGYAIVWVFIRKEKEEESTNSSYNAENNNSNGVTEYHQQQKSTNNENISEELRIFSCPSCKQKIRIKIPLQGETGKCSKCNSRYHIHNDEYGNLYVTSSYDSEEQKTRESQIESIDDCLAVLGLMKNASSSDIKLAYRTKMKGYHPDKVAHLGEKLKIIADREAKRLNTAYAILKDRGYI